jgi:hypothetical protein
MGGDGWQRDVVSGCAGGFGGTGRAPPHIDSASAERVKVVDGNGASKWPDADGETLDQGFEDLSRGANLTIYSSQARPGLWWRFN